jgi:hypothetical protein
MDRIKNPNEIKYLKVPTYVLGIVLTINHMALPLH